MPIHLKMNSGASESTSDACPISATLQYTAVVTLTCMSVNTPDGLLATIRACVVELHVERHYECM